MTSEQFQLDYRARDTLGNFTSLVDELKDRGIQHIFVVTSSDHYSRSISVGRVVAGSRGIRLTGIPISCEPDCLKEGALKYTGDVVRAITWVATGKDIRDAANPDQEDH